MRAWTIVALAALGVILVTKDFVAAPSIARTTSIFMTTNHNKGTGNGQYAAECLGVVSTETLPAANGDSITWHIKTGNGHDEQDRCANLDPSKVELHFATNVMGTSQTLVGGRGNTIRGTVAASSQATNGRHKYQVFYKGVAAGPDPEIDVNCDTCGPGGNGPTPATPGNH